VEAAARQLADAVAYEVTNVEKHLIEQEIPRHQGESLHDLLPMIAPVADVAWFEFDEQLDPGLRHNGVLISAEHGAAVAYALWKLQDRGRMFVSPGDPLYEGMVIGIHSRDNDLVVNPIKGKQLTNVRSSGTDEAVRLVPPIELTIEKAVEFIADDELVEITPKSIRIRKRHLLEHERKRASRTTNSETAV
jgi:predicted membrane GTPase involved in stress response